MSGADRIALAVGARVAGRLEDGGCTVVRQFPMPGTVAGIAAAVQELLLAIEALGGQVRIVHHRPAAPAGSRPEQLQLLPVDRDWLRSLAERKWVSRTLPAFTMDWRELFSALIRQHLFVALYRALAESMASENASRLASMRAAERNIQEHLSRLSAAYHQSRQQAITEELLDIVAGFEALARRPRQARRPRSAV